MFFRWPIQDGTIGHKLDLDHQSQELQAGHALTFNPDHLMGAGHTRPIRYHKETIIDSDGTSREIVTPQEKGVDVRLALDVVSRARRREFNVAVIYSQDQDLCEVVQEVREISKQQDRWIKVACAYPHGPAATSRRGIDGTDWIQMDQTFYDACLDPRDYRSKR